MLVVQLQQVQAHNNELADQKSKLELSLDKKIRETSDLLTENQKLESRLAGADEDYRRYTIPPLAPLEVPGSYRNAMYIPYPENALLLMFCLETVSISRVNA
jgi:hypothetical protein